MEKLRPWQGCGVLIFVALQLWILKTMCFEFRRSELVLVGKEVIDTRNLN